MSLIREAIKRSISRRSFLKGVGSLAAAPLLTGLGGSVLAGCSSSSSASSDPDNFNTKLVILGSSGGVGCWPGSNRASSSSALVVNGTLYLIDLGQGSMSRLNEVFNTQSAVDGKGNYIPPASSTFLSQVKALFFTHLHQDHIADYATLLLIGAGAGLGNATQDSKGWATNPLQVIGPCNRGQLDNNNNPFITDMDAWVINAYSPIPPMVTPTPGTLQMTDMIWQAFAQAINDIMLDDGYPNYTSLVKVREIGTELPSRGSNTCPATPPFQIYPSGGGKDENGVSVSATLVDHRQVYPAFAFRFDTPDGSVVFSGDTGPNTTADRSLPPNAIPNGNLQVLANGADILVHEVIDTDWINAHFGNPDPASPAGALKTHMQNAHTQVDYVGQVAAYCNVKTLVLNHIIPGMAPVSHLLKAQQNFSGQLIISQDMMQMGVSRLASKVLAGGM